MFEQLSTSGFAATVKEVNGSTFVIAPHIIEVDSQNHPQVNAISRDGVTPGVGDIVFVLTMRNNFDFENINRYFGASDSNCVIVGVLKTDADPQYVLEGNYKFDGDLLVTGDAVFEKSVTVKGSVTVENELTVGGVAFSTHTHAPGTYVAPSGGGPVTGASGAPS